MGNEQSEFDREGNSHGEQKERRDNNSKSEDHSSGQKERRVEATPNASEPSQISCKSTSKKVRDQAATPDPTLVDSTNQHLMQREAKQGPLDAAGNDALQEFSSILAGKMAEANAMQELQGYGAQPSMMSGVRLVGRVMGEDGRMKNIIAVDPSQLSPDQLQQLRERQEIEQIVGMEEKQRFQCGGPATDVPGRCLCGFKHIRASDGELVDHLLHVMTPLGKFELGFNYNDDPIIVADKFTESSGIKHAPIKGMYEAAMNQVIDAVMMINQRDEEIEKGIPQVKQYQNGERTKTKSPYCHCGFKHWFFGREVDFVEGFPGHGTTYAFGYNVGDDPEAVLEEFFVNHPFVTRQNEPLKVFIRKRVAKQTVKHIQHGRRLPNSDDYPTLAMHKAISISAGSENAVKFVDKIKAHYLECTKEELNPQDLVVLAQLQDMIGNDFKSFATKEVPPYSFILMDKLVRRLPQNKVWPCVDMLRFLVTHPVVSEYCVADSSLFNTVVSNCCREGSDPIAHMMALRMIANFVCHPKGSAFYLKQTSSLNSLLYDLLISTTNETSPQYNQFLVAIVTILHNLSPFLRKKHEEVLQAVGVLVLILAKPTLGENEGFNGLMALGVNISLNPFIVQQLFMSMHDREFLEQWRSGPKNTKRIQGVLRDLDYLMKNVM